MPQRLLAILFCLLLHGCVIIDIGVTNPLPGMSRVAVVPFRNLTTQPSQVADGRRFAMAYASELQKVPGFEVVPVGVAEVAMREGELHGDSPEDLLQLARILKVDAVVVGAVTEYDPYYPPRIGLQVEWLSPEPWTFSPGVQTEERARKRFLSLVTEERDQQRKLRKQQRGDSKTEFRVPVSIRGQSQDPPETDGEAAGADKWLAAPLPLRPASSGPLAGNSLSPSLFRDSPPTAETAAEAATPLPPLPSERDESPDDFTEGDDFTRRVSPVAPPSIMSPHTPPIWLGGTTPAAPLMAYSRYFDGADADLVAELRDYAELNGDLRGGGWEAYLQRSDDFIRFCCHRMIEEMLTLHGGEARRRIVFKLRKYR